jgi:hypothetical protein
MILQKREKVILQICIATVALVATYVAVIEPVFKQWVEASDELRAKQQLLEKSRQLITQKKNLKQEFNRIQSLVWQGVGLEEYSARFLLQVEKAGRLSGVKQITSISPLPIKEEKDYQQLQSQINFDADISGVTRFLYELTKEKYFIIVDRLQVDSSLEDPEILKCQLIVSTIYLNTKGK